MSDTSKTVVPERAEFENLAAELYGGDITRFLKRCPPPHEDEYAAADLQAAWRIWQAAVARHAGIAGPAPDSLAEKLVDDLFTPVSEEAKRALVTMMRNSLRRVSGIAGQTAGPRCTCGWNTLAPIYHRPNCPAASPAQRAWSQTMADTLPDGRTVAEELYQDSGSIAAAPCVEGQLRPIAPIGLKIIDHPKLEEWKKQGCAKQLPDGLWLHYIAICELLHSASGEEVRKALVEALRIAAADGTTMKATKLAVEAALKLAEEQK